MNYVNYDEFDPNRLYLENLNFKSFTSKHPFTDALDEENYFTLNIYYMYPSVGYNQEVCDLLVVKFPPVYSTGISVDLIGSALSVACEFSLTNFKSAKFAKTTWSNYDHLNPAVNGYYSIIWNSICEKFYNIRYKFTDGSRWGSVFQSVNSLECMKCYAHMPMNIKVDYDGERVFGTPASVHLLLNEHEVPWHPFSKISQLNLNGSPIDWKQLRCANFIHTPYVEFSGLTITTNYGLCTTFDMGILKSDILEICPSHSSTWHTQIVEELIANDPNVSHRFDTNMELINNIKQQLSLVKNFSFPAANIFQAVNSDFDDSSEEIFDSIVDNSKYNDMDDCGYKQIHERYNSSTTKKSNAIYLNGEECILK